MTVIDQVGLATLFRGARPTVDELRRVKFDINLEVGWFEWWHRETNQERVRCGQLDIAYLHRPVSDFFRPSRIELLRIADQCRFWVFKGHSVLFHCLHGEDRTGLVAATYRIKYQGWSVDNAIDEMYEMGFHKFPYKTPLGWQKILKTIR